MCALIMLRSLVRFQLAPLLTSTFVALVTRSGAFAPQCTTAGARCADVSAGLSSSAGSRDFSMAATPKLAGLVCRAANGWSCSNRRFERGLEPSDRHAPGRGSGRDRGAYRRFRA